MNGHSRRQSWPPLIPQVSDQLFPIVDQMYARSSELAARGIHVFELDHTFIAAICREQTEVEEERSHTLLRAKHDLSRETYAAKEIGEMVRRGRQRSAETGNHWDAQPTQYLKRFRRMLFESQDEVDRLQSEFNARIREAWAQESETHQHGEYRAFEPDSAPARRALVEHLFALGCPPLGFAFDAKCSRGGVFAYSKVVDDSWELFMAVDFERLEKPIGGPSQVLGRNVLTRPLGPDFVMVFGVADRTTKNGLRADNPEVLMLRFEWFLPIRKAPLWSDYRKFYSLRELEALVNIHLVFYEILSRDFEVAVRRGLAGSLTARS